MAESTTDLLLAVNRVLLDVGERQVNVISSPAARKAKAYLQEAFQDVQTFGDWSWQFGFLTADSWDVEKATYSGLKRVRAARFFNDSVYREITYTDPSSFYRFRELTSFTDKADCPQYFTILSNDTLAFNPYPTDLDGQVRITIQGYKQFDPPELPTDVFMCPEEYVYMIIKRAVYMMLVRHLGELNEAQAMAAEFNQKLQYMLSKDKATVTRGTNMFRRTTGGYRRRL